MFSHAMFGARDLPSLIAFYDAVLAPLGLKRREMAGDGGPPGACWVRPGEHFPQFFVQVPFDGAPASAGNGVMLAFLATERAAVDAAHAAGLAHGGTDEGAPGPRPHYGDGYHGAYLRDPEGNKLHLVVRGDAAA